MDLLPRLPDLPWCPCLDPQGPAAAVRDLLDELRELCASRCRADVVDELSDSAFALGRLLAGLVARRYLPVPLAGPHIDKVTRRQQDHGCVRSPRHLVDGRCPSLDSH